MMTVTPALITPAKHAPSPSAGIKPLLAQADSFVRFGGPMRSRVHYHWRQEAYRTAANPDPQQAERDKAFEANRPEIFKLMGHTLYTDQHGSFTGRNLLNTIAEYLTEDANENRVPSNNDSHFLREFAPSVRPAVITALEAMVKLDLLKATGNTHDNTLDIERLTSYGKQARLEDFQPTAQKPVANPLLRVLQNVITAVTAPLQSTEKVVEAGQ